MSLVTIPSDLLFDIIAYLSLTDWSALARTCTYLRKLSVHDGRVWKAMLTRDYPRQAASRALIEEPPLYQEQYSTLQRLLALPGQEEEDTTFFDVVEPNSLDYFTNNNALISFFYLRAPLCAHDTGTIDIIPDYVVRLQSNPNTQAYVMYFGGVKRDNLIPHPPNYDDDWESDPTVANNKIRQALKAYRADYGPFNYLELSARKTKDFACSLIELGYVTSFETADSLFSSLYKTKWVEEPDGSSYQVDVWSRISDLFCLE